MTEHCDGPIDIEPLRDLGETDERIREMLRYWQDRSCDDVADRGDIDPLLDIPALAPDLFMVNVIDRGGDFVVRLVGTRVVERYGSDTTGRSVKELSAGAYREAILSLMRACLRLRRPIYSVTNYLHPARSYLNVERLIMPLRNGGDTIEILLVLQLFHDGDAASRNLHSEVIADIERAGAVAQFQAYSL